MSQYAAIVPMVESQSVDYRPNDFNWSALDNPSEMNCNPDCGDCCPVFYFPSFGRSCIILLWLCENLRS